jgi:hypothetical protein
MLRSLKNLDGYAVAATDGDIGSVVNFFLDDEHWVVRYLIVETGGFFGGRPVLISPISFREVEWATQHLHLALTREKVKNSPNVDVHQPVSRQHELDYFHYFGYPPYWGYSGLWAMGGAPGLLGTNAWTEMAAEHSGAFKASGDVHLRSAKEIRGYHVQGSDDAIGHIEDFIVDDETWEVRYLVIDTSNWWLGKKVLIAPQWATGVSWEEGKVFIDLPRQAIKGSPEWDANAAVNREYETHLYDYYGRPAYWAGGNPPVQTQPPSSPKRSRSVKKKGGAAA